MRVLQRQRLPNSRDLLSTRPLKVYATPRASVGCPRSLAHLAASCAAPKKCPGCGWGVPRFQETFPVGLRPTITIYTCWLTRTLQGGAALPVLRRAERLLRLLIAGEWPNTPIRAGFLLPFKEAQCFAPGWIYAGGMFDFSWRRAPQSSSTSRFTAGAAAFFILSQSGERPER